MTKIDEVEFLIVDANIVIDYLDCDEKIFVLIKEHIGQVYLAAPLLEEVNALDLTICHRLGIIIVEPTIEQLSWAAEQEFSISLQDKICLTMARDHNWALVTNDKALRKRCESEKIKLVWGVELIRLLCETGGLHINRVMEGWQHQAALVFFPRDDNIPRQPRKKSGSSTCPISSFY